MNTPLATVPAAPDPAGTYRCGTLTYTRMQLAALFFWLLWGDFCYVLMETVVPSLMPLRFQALSASNTSIGLILVTIPMSINTVFNPVISFRSDRFRSRWGRRIPFILFTLPLLVVCLLGLTFADRLGFWLHAALGRPVAILEPEHSGDRGDRRRDDFVQLLQYLRQLGLLVPFQRCGTRQTPGALSVAVPHGKSGLFVALQPARFFPWPARIFARS